MKVYLMTGEVNRGMLVYCKEGPIINLDSGILIDSSDNVQFSFPENSAILKMAKLTKNDHVLLIPDVVI